MKKNLILVFLFLVFFATFAAALDIPLEGTTSAGKGGTSIGYVDMDLIFDLYPQTKFAKEDYAKQLKTRRDELKKRETELEDLRTRIIVLEQTLKSMDGSAPPPPTEPDESLANSEAVDPAKTPVPKNPEDVSALKQQLEDKKAEYEEARNRSKEELNHFQNKQSQLILGKLYEALRDLAQEEQVHIVVDKASILYGGADIDLTEKLRNKVRGY